MDIFRLMSLASRSCLRDILVWIYLYDLNITIKFRIKTLILYDFLLNALVEGLCIACFYHVK